MNLAGAIARHGAEGPDATTFGPAIAEAYATKGDAIELGTECSTARSCPKRPCASPSRR